MRISRSARKHGVKDADIRHAVRYRIHGFDEDEDVTMVIGPARSGLLLEVGVLNIDHDAVAIHAMAARPKYIRRLPFGRS